MYLALEGTNTYLAETGAGDPVLFLHGVPDSADMWRPIMVRLQGRYHSYAPDLPGLGRSTAPDDFALTLELCERLLADQHDLIHKACGWMLREVGKRDERVLVRWLDRFAPRMPRTMLRYAIERFGERKRLAYLKARLLKR